ncbi:MAG: glycerol-3-phosphate 1-O-acyltransferase PlsY [Lachnospiraceae bacterium]
MERLICVVIGYAFGLLQTGYFYGKIHHVDIRQHGSGNAGTTNALRTLGLKAGAITFFGDCFKCIGAIVVVHFIYRNTYPQIMPLLAMYAGMGAVIGHNYPFYLKFQGGKGIAATAGLIVSTNIWMAVICMVAFAIIVGVTRYVSLGSLVVVVLFAIEVVIYGQGGHFGLAQGQLYEMYAVVIFLMLSAFYKHRANIQRLVNGTENKFGMKKKGE